LCGGWGGDVGVGGVGVMMFWRAGLGVGEVGLCVVERVREMGCAAAQQEGMAARRVKASGWGATEQPYD